MASPEAQKIGEQLRSWPAPDGVSIEEWRRRAGTPDVTESAGVVTWPVVDASGGSVWAAVGPTTGRRGDAPVPDGPIMVWFHGGGFVVCSVATHRVTAAYAAAAIGGTALVADYRLAPEARFPAAIHDGVAMLRWLRAAGVESSRTVIAGDSAGGNLAITVTMALRDAGDQLPAAVVAVSPWTDLTLSAPSLLTHRTADPFAHLDDLPRMRDLYLGDADPTDPLASPLFADLAGLPPIVAVVGDTETLLDDSSRLVDAVRAAGGTSELVVVEGAFHTWLNYAGRLPEADGALAAIGEFVRPLL